MLSAPPKIQMLIELTRNNLIVRGCIGRVLSAIVPQRVHIRERTGPGAQFKALKPELEKFLESYLSKFLTSALESTLVCGFVVFVIRRHILHGNGLSCGPAEPVDGRQSSALLAGASNLAALQARGPQAQPHAVSVQAPYAQPQARLPRHRL